MIAPDVSSTGVSPNIFQQSQDQRNRLPVVTCSIEPLVSLSKAKSSVEWNGHTLFSETLRCENQEIIDDHAEI